VHRFILTPSRKHIGRAAARNTKRALVTEVLKNEAYREDVLKKIGVLVRRELTLMCSERVKSILSSSHQQFYTNSHGMFF